MLEGECLLYLDTYIETTVGEKKAVNAVCKRLQGTFACILRS